MFIKLLLIILLGCIKAFSPQQDNPISATMQQSASSDTDKVNTKRVAFIGNSIIYYNDCPRFLVNLSQGHVNIHQDSCLRGGTNLQQLWEQGNGMSEHGFKEQQEYPTVQSLLECSKDKQTYDYIIFNDPSDFQALNRVIDIIGAEIDNSGGDIRPGSEIGTNFTHLQQYQSIQHQQRIVEEVIEHMAVKHCADLNSSVAAVGRMSRQFDEAKLRVKNLRRQVRDVKDSLRLGELGDVATDLVRFVGDIFR